MRDKALSFHTQTREQWSSFLTKNKTAVGIAQDFLFGLIASRAAMFSSIAPFGVAYLAACPSGSLIGCLIGTLLGYFLPYGNLNTTRYIVGCLIVFAIRYVLQKGPLTKHMLFASLLAGGSIFASGLTLNFLLPQGFYGIAMSVCESILGAATAFFFTRTLFLREHLQKLSAVLPTDYACAVLSLCLMAMSISQLTIGSISIGRIVLVMLILWVSFTQRQPASGIIGMAIGMSMALVSPDQFYLLGSYGLGGMLAGIFAMFGKFGCCAIFAIVNAVCILISPSMATALPGMYEVLIATAIFMLIPTSLLNRLSASVHFKSSKREPIGFQNVVSSRLNLASKAILNISSTVDDVSKKLDDIAASDLSGVFSRACDSVCAGCGMKMFCWHMARDQTLDSFNKITPLIRSKKSLSKEDLPVYFSDKCCKVTQLVAEINRNYTDYLAYEGANRRVLEMRSVVVDQFSGISHMLESLSREIGDLSDYDPDSAEQVKSALAAADLYPQSVSACIDGYDKMNLEILFLKQNYREENLHEMAQLLSEVCSRVFDDPSTMTIGEYVKLNFFEKARYSMLFGSHQITHSNMPICGDCFDCFLDAKGNAHMILSDGMGSGSRAAVDSSMASALTSQLIGAGFDYDTTLKIVNSALLVKSGDETLATLDIATFDLFTGKVEFLKAGAAPTFIKRAGKIGRIESVSMPVGILRGTSFERNSMTLRDGDLVVLVSDGVTATGIEWILSEIELFSDKLSPSELAKQIAEEAKRRRIDGHEDDITVLVGSILKGV